jgi:hypothetical protein
VHYSINRSENTKNRCEIQNPQVKKTQKLWKTTKDMWKTMKVRRTLLKQ